MKFIVEKEIFEKLPNACFGVVMAKGIDNNKTYPEIEQLLDESIAAAAQRFEGKKVKEEPDILPYREAFRALGINPNKYLCSIEALFTRIAKGKGMPHINPVVGLGNAVSLKYTLPMGAHDLGGSSEDICIRLAQPGDTFLPFGGETEETPDSGEVIMPSGIRCVPAAGLGGRANTERSRRSPRTFSSPLTALQILTGSRCLPHGTSCKPL